MSDKEFLQWIYDRMVYVHNENPNFDYMHKLRSIIAVNKDSRISFLCDLLEQARIHCLTEDVALVAAIDAALETNEEV